MEAVWYAIIAVMVAVYVVLDGFDFGAGIVHLLVAKTDKERRLVLNAIGPLWDGNEVWLLAAGGVMVYAFPRIYASAFSGFYLALMLVLWLLILRGISIEYRSKEENPRWRNFWDGVFCVSSALMAIVLGAALGNLIRGVPINANQDFNEALITNFMPGANPGILDWFTVLIGVFGFSVLAGHGALFLAWKTTGDLQARSRALGKKLWTANIGLWVLVSIGCAIVQSPYISVLASRPLAWLFAVVSFGAVGLIFASISKGNDLGAFLGSALYIVGVLAGIASVAYPNILISTLNPSYTMTAASGSVGSAASTIGIVWWIAAMVLALCYYVYVYRQFSGKVQLDAEGHGY